MSLKQPGKSLCIQLRHRELSKMLCCAACMQNSHTSLERKLHVQPLQDSAWKPPRPYRTRIRCELSCLTALTESCLMLAWATQSCLRQSPHPCGALETSHHLTTWIATSLHNTAREQPQNKAHCHATLGPSRLGVGSRCCAVLHACKILIRPLKPNYMFKLSKIQLESP